MKSSLNRIGSGADKRTDPRFFKASLASQGFGPGALISAGRAIGSGIKRRIFGRGRRARRRSVSNMIERNLAEFSVATFNLRGVSDRYRERRKMLQLCIRDEIDADVLCFQECLTGEYGQDRQLLGKSYHVFGCKAALFHLMESGNNLLRLYARSVMKVLGFSPLLRLMVSLPEPFESFRERFYLQGSFFRTLRDLSIAPFFGNSIATRLVDLHEINHSTLILGDWRAAQRIKFELLEDEIDGAETGPRAVPPIHDAATPGAKPRFKIWIVNTHLDHEHPDNRERQALQVIEWMEAAREGCSAVVLCGDFNGNPSESFHQLLQSKGYRSGYRMRHGAEPLGTWPTGIEAPLKDEGPFECLDYVYVWAAEDIDLKIVDAQVFGDHSDPKDPTLYPSDHAAIKVTLRLEKKEPSLEPGDEVEITVKGLASS